MKIYIHLLVMRHLYCIGLILVLASIKTANGQIGPTTAQICPGDIITIEGSLEWEYLYDGTTRRDNVWQVRRTSFDNCGETLKCGPRPEDPSYILNCQECYQDLIPDWRPLGTGPTQLGTSPSVANTIIHFRYRTSSTTPWQNSASVTILDSPPVLNNVPTSDDLVLDFPSEAIYLSSTLEIQHVKCKGEGGAKIIIKSLSNGTGEFLYSLRKNGSSSTVNINRLGFGRPSPSSPVIFPDHSPDVFNITSGHYLLTIENLVWNGTIWEKKCSDKIVNLYVKEPQSQLSATHTLTNRNGYQISCPGNSDGQIQITPSGGIGPYQVSWNGGAFQSTTTVSGLAASSGNTVHVRDALGCIVTISGINITQPDPLTFTAPVLSTIPEDSGINITCLGGTGSIQINATGGAGTKTFQLMDEFGTPVPGNDTPDTVIPNPTFDGIPAGTYKVRVNDLNLCSATTSNIVLVEPTDLNLTIGTITPPSCLGGTDGKVELIPSGGIPKPGSAYKVTVVGLEAQSSKNKTGTTVELTDFQAGTYTIRVEGEYCDKDFNASLLMPENPTPVNFDPIFTEPSCNGLADGSITITGRDGFPFNADEYKFSFESGPFTAVSANSIVYNTNIGSGVYSIGIEDSRGCRQYNNVIVTEPSLIANSFTIAENICRGESGGEILATISGATAPYTIEWRDAANVNVLKSETVPSATTLSGLPEAGYKLLIKDDHGCTNHETDWYTLNTAITDPEFLLLGHSFFDNVSCNGVGDGEVTLLASGGWSGYTYSKNGGAYVPSNSFQSLTPGDYVFSVSDSRGCITTYNRTVTEPDVFTSSLSTLSNVKCFGDATGSVEMNLAGGTTPYEQSFDGGLNFIPGNIISVLPEGNHTILSRDANGCTATVPIVVTEPPLLEIEVTHVVHTLCGYAHGEGIVAAQGGTLPFAFDWKTSAGASVRSQPSVTALYPDAYTVTVTDGNLCTADVLVLVNNTDGPTITNTAITDATCSYSSEGAIDLTVAGGQLPYQYYWSNSATTEDIAGLFQGRYLVEVRDDNNCRFFKEVKVGAPPKMDAQVVASVAPTCFDFTDGQLEVNATGGNGNYTYAWNNGMNSNRIENIAAGTYTVDITDQRGCIFSKNFVFDNPDRFSVDLGPDRTICVGQTFAADGGTAVTYLWSNDNGYSANSRNVTLNEPATYRLKVTNEAGCVAEDEFELATSLDLLRADFVLATEGHAKDTIVALDISWPLPERIEWTFDKTARIIYNGQDRAEMVYETRGDYSLTLTTALAECRATYTQSITILDERPNNSGGRIKTESSLFSRFELFPNPNNGNFSAAVELSQEMPIFVNMVDLASNRNVFSKQFSGKNIYEIEVKVDVGAGVYVFTVQAGKEVRTKRIIISR